jgi:microcystin-dependent protein
VAEEVFGGSLPSPPYPPVIPAVLDSLARSQILLDGDTIGYRRGINVIIGEGVSITATDDSINERVDITIAGSSLTTGDVKTGLQTASHGNWLLLDGSSFSGATFPNLQTLLGGTTLPDMRGRSPVGAGTGSGLSTRTIRTTGGEETHAQTLAEIAVHTHTQNSHNHTQDSHNHTQNSHSHSHNHGTGAFSAFVTNESDAGDPGGVLTGLSEFGVAVTDTETDATTATATNIATTATNQVATATNQNAGSGTAFNVMHPFYVVNFFIWAA